jgi:transcriptional regulator with XRE-family HTH domain
VNVDDMTPAVRKACAARDIGAAFRFLRDGGITQRELAVLVRMNQSEITEIISGCQVLAYDVFVRIANGLGIPRGLMGLSYGEHEPASVEEVDEDVERRKLFALAGFILFGNPVFGEPEPLAVRRVLIDPPQRVGMADVCMYEATVVELQALQRTVGGRATREPLVATAKAGEQLLKAEATSDVRRRLRFLVSDAHRRAGWAAGDIGLVADYRFHMHAALDLAVGDPDRIAQVLCTAGAIEKSLGDPEFALKLLQIGQTAAAGSADPQVRAVLGGEAVAGYVTAGRPDVAKRELTTARSLFADADISKSLPGFAAYGNGHGVLASAELKLGNFEAARTEILSALRKRPKDDAWCNTLDTIILATINMRAGEVREGVQNTKQALVLVRRVGSVQLQDRMMPLTDELDRRNDSTCRDLARAVRAVKA